MIHMLYLVNHETVRKSPSAQNVRLMMQIRHMFHVGLCAWHVEREIL